MTAEDGAGVDDSARDWQVSGVGGRRRISLNKSGRCSRLTHRRRHSHVGTGSRSDSRSDHKPFRAVLATEVMIPLAPTGASANCQRQRQRQRLRGVLDGVKLATGQGYDATLSRALLYTHLI